MHVGRTARRCTCKRRILHAVSYVEVLIVIAIIILLMAMLLPSLQAAREKVRRIVCANNLRQFGNASHLYQEENFGYLPTEGTYLAIDKPGTWFNTLPKYLNFPAYKDIERIDQQIKEFPQLHVWICPSKERMGAYKSLSGKNQFHYGMNQVLDGLGTEKRPSKDTPGFVDTGTPLRAARFSRHPNTVFMFDIAPNSPAGTQRDVATKYQRNRHNAPVGEFHGDFANILCLDGAVSNCKTDDLVRNRDFRRGDLVWDLQELYWGWMPKRRPAGVD